jgi:hypothetical protein
MKVEKCQPKEVIRDFVFANCDELGHATLGIAANACEYFFPFLLTTSLNCSLPGN